MALLNAVHHRAVHNRRVHVLAHHLAQIIPGGGRVLDVGCGDGLISREIMNQRPDLEIEGVDVMLRPITHIPATTFNGSVLPFGDDSFDYVTIVDVLHHTTDPVIMIGGVAPGGAEGRGDQGSPAGGVRCGRHAARDGLGGEPRARRGAAVQLSLPWRVG